MSYVCQAVQSELTVQSSSQALLCGLNTTISKEIQEKSTANKKRPALD